MAMKPWKLCSEKLPSKEGYYSVRYADGTTDEKWYRIRGDKQGWLDMREIVAWR